MEITPIYTRTIFAAEYAVGSMEPTACTIKTLPSCGGFSVPDGHSKTTLLQFCLPQESISEESFPLSL